jgi:hypothetical protein
LPGLLGKLFAPFSDDMPWLFTPDGDIELGPIPKGTPVALLGNLDLRPDKGTLLDRVRYDHKLVELVIQFMRHIRSLPRIASESRARRVFADLVAPLLELSKCPDFVVNRGHYFGTDQFVEEPGLSDWQKLDLIEYLKIL